MTENSLFDPGAIKRVCTKCQKGLPITEFYKAKKATSGRQSRCRACTKQDARARAVKAGITYLEYCSRRYLKSTYGLSVHQYNEMVKAQNGLCAICKRPPGGGNSKNKLCVDHNHSTGKIRALLCDHCNKAIGMMQDSPTLLRAAADYITSHEQKFTE